MDNCEYCNKKGKSNVRTVRCGFPSCTFWVHEPCADTQQVSKTGYWYCKFHIKEIPEEQRVDSEEKVEYSISSKDDESSEEDEKTSINKKSNKGEKPEIPLKTPNIPVTEKLEENKSANLQSEDSAKFPRASDLDINKFKSQATYDNGSDDNPFANFNCEHCQGNFTLISKGVLCVNCRSTFHIACLNKEELESKNNSKFHCQYCIQDKIRLERLKEKQRKDMKATSEKDKFNSNSNNIVPHEVDLKNRNVHSKKSSESKPKEFNKDSHSSRTKSKKHLDISFSSSCSSDFSSEEYDDKIVKKYEKLKKIIKSRKSHSKKLIDSESSLDSDSDDSSEVVSQEDAMVKLYKQAQEDRNRSKFEKLPIVDCVDTKWSIFFDLFSRTRKLFSHSENVLRIQSAIKCKEILDIGGINLFDPRAYWQAIKLIDKRLCQSYNLLQKETIEIIKLKKLKYDSDSKKIIEFINKIVNYSSIIDKYGTNKHKIDDRVISHIGNIMPNSMLNGWHKLKAKLEENNKIISLSHVADYLSKQVAYLTSKMQSEELDPWKDQEVSMNRSFKRRDFNNRRSYSTYSERKSNTDNSQNFQNYCWLHKTKSHSAFKCSKLWSMSGKEVSDLAKQNNVCTFCGHKKHRDCPAARNLNCRIENCKYKHHILFCYKRVGRENKDHSSQNKNYMNKKHNGNNKNSSERKDRRSLDGDEKNSLHLKDDGNEIRKPNENEESDIEIPQSSMYINNPPKTIRIKSNSTNAPVVMPSSHHVRYHASNDSTFESFSHNNNLSNNNKRTSSCILGVLVVNFLDSNEKVPLLLDSGSTVSIIEESLADKLQIKGLWHPLRLNWSSNMSRIDYTSRIVKAKVSSVKPDSKTYELYLRTVKNLNMHDQPFNAAEIVELYPHLKHLNLTSYSRIYGIIGLDNLWCFDQHKVFKPKNWDPSIPYGIRGPLGDIVMGNLNQLEDIYNYLRENDNENCSNHITSTYSYNHSLSEEERNELAQIEKRILGSDYDSFNFDDNEIFEEKIALEKLDKNVRRSENNINFEAPLLFKDDNVILPTEKSFKASFRRLMIVEKNSILNGRFEECVAQVDNLLNKGYAEVVPEEEINKKGNKVYYIPTFFIQPKNKRTRFIWDAATKIDGKSLNDHLMTGPNLYTNYLKIIFQMQEGKFLVKGDLQEMFHQVFIRKEDRDSLRFLFRRSPDEKVQILRMKVMIFGAKSSPTISQYVKNKIASEFLETNLDAANVILHSTYVDDVITSTDDLEYCKSLISDIRTILKSGGFNLVKLKGNNDEILDLVRTHLSEDDLQNEKLFSTESEEKLLGYLINFETDEMKIALTLEKIPAKILNFDEKPTKKQVLQLVMSIFDPVGFVEFLLSKFKLMYHWLIKDKYEWNQIIDDSYFNTWKKCITWLKELHNLKIPRLYSLSLANAHIKQLIGFGDAGTEMLCTVIYVRLLDNERKQLGYRFICAKSYTVPLKQSRTIPELEVDVACKLSVLMSKVETSHRIAFDEKVYCTDNVAVREWIVHGAKSPRVYVRNRLAKISTLSKPEEWRWVPTHLQPADFGTKMNSMPQISYNNDWFHPPIFQMPEGNWPKIEANNEFVSTHMSNNEEVETADKNLSFLHKFSSFDRLIKAVMKSLEWRHRIKIIKINKEISDIKKAQIARTRSANKQRADKLAKLKSRKLKIFKSINMIWDSYYEVGLSLVRISQKEAYSDELKCLANKKPLKKSNPLYKWLPYIDDNGIMRVQSRITNNEINRQKFTFDRISPIILHRNHHLTKLIILKYHHSQAHHNEKTVVVNLLQRFFIHKIKRTVNNVIRNDCLMCKITNAKPEVPLMGDVPDVKLAMQTHVFSNVIIDLLGPIHVKGTRFVTNKRYILVYSCLTTRALHLELIESLESHATLRALQNTFNLRGVPNHIYSDNGTNFTGGNKIIQDCHNDWNQDLLNRGVITHAIQWHFSPPKTPHMNGSVERVVGLVKKALKCIQHFMDLKKSLYDDYGLKAVLCEIINMVNSRPIEILSGYEGQSTFLTPNFFIMHRQNAQTVPPDITVPKTLTQQWNDIKMISNILWEKWLKFYFPIMMAREKWVDRSKPLEIGDIVVTADPSIANSWRLGVVENIVMGSQDQVRKITVRLGKNKGIDKNSLKNASSLKKAYKDEIDTIIVRPAIAVARINLKSLH